MSEESILILNMLREGKITAEQADALLRAVRQTAPQAPPAPAAPAAPPPPPAPAVDPATLAAMQNKLGDLQNKLGDLQGKLGAAQAARAAGQAVSIAGKMFDHMHKPDVDFSKISKTVDEAMRGLNSLKNDAMRTARVAGRQAAQEARKAARQGRKSMKFDLNINCGDGGHDSGRPQNNTGQAEASESGESSVSWTGASALSFENAYGSVKVVGDDTVASGAAQATLTKTAWAASESDARILLQQIFLTTRVENGRCRVEVVAPSDAQDRVTVDYEIRIPRNLPLEVSTTFGDIEAEEVSAELKTGTVSGGTVVRRPQGDAAGEAHLESRSGGIRLESWNTPETRLTVETASGDITGDGLTCRTVALTSRSGDVTLAKLQTLAEADLESVSGDVSVSGGSVGTRGSVKTQSGDITLRDLRTEQLSVETVSGDAHLEAVTGALSAKTVSGDIEASSVQSPAVALGSVSGDMRCAFAAPFSGSLAGTTVSGDLAVALWTNSDTRVELSTTNGGLTCALPLSDRSPENARHLNGKIGDGIGSIKLQSVSGDLHIEAEK